MHHLICTDTKFVKQIHHQVHKWSLGYLSFFTLTVKWRLLLLQYSETRLTFANSSYNNNFQYKDNENP